MSKKKKIKKRIFEMYPGIVAWVVITCPIWGGIFFPVATGYFILIFNAFWVYKSISSVLFFIIGYLKIRNNENVDWMGKLARLENPHKGIVQLNSELKDLTNEKFSKKKYIGTFYDKVPTILQKLVFAIEKKKAKKFLKDEIEKLKQLKAKSYLNWKDLRHIVIIPFWKEPYTVLKRSLDKLANQTFPNKKISVVLGAEARHPPAYKLAKKLQKEYKDKFEYIWANEHTLTKDEIAGKASNMADCGKMVQEKIEKLGWDKDKITVSSCDCDTQFDRQYFAYLTYLFATDEDRYVRFYAAPMMYYANFWRVPFYSRVANTLFTINNIGMAARMDKYIQVSSYSFSWRLLEDINFWSADIMPEDFHMFFKALFVHGDKVVTKPIFLRNLSDAAESVNHRGTIKNQYEQVKRWAWGVSDHGWMIESWWKSKKTFYMTYRVFHTIFDHLTWSIISFVLLFGANIPPLINKDFAKTVFGQKLPEVSSFMMTITSVTFVFTIIFDFFLKPRRKEEVSIFRIIFEQLKWVTFPIVSFVFGAIPGLDAQTRLLFGKYLEYRLTEKH